MYLGMDQSKYQSPADAVLDRRTNTTLYQKASTTPGCDVRAEETGLVHIKVHSWTANCPAVDNWEQPMLVYLIFDCLLLSAALDDELQSLHMRVRSLRCILTRSGRLHARSHHLSRNIRSPCPSVSFLKAIQLIHGTGIATSGRHTRSAICQ